MNDQETRGPKIVLRTLNGLDERNAAASENEGLFDILKGAIPIDSNTLTKVNGCKTLIYFAGERILNIHQTFDSRRNLIIQTFGKVRIISEEEFFGYPYSPQLTTVAFNEEDTMPQALIGHIEPSGNPGGASTIAYLARSLNTIVSQLNADGTAASFLTLNSALKQFTLATGVYRIRGWVIGQGGTTAVKLNVQLFNVTAALPAWNGLSNQDGESQLTRVADKNQRLDFGGALNLLVPTTFEIRQKASVALAVIGFGSAAASAGANEIYAWADIIKTA